MNTPSFKNAKWAKSGDKIDCEIDHPQYGWIPFSCVQNDNGAEFDTNVLYRLLLEAGPVAYQGYQFTEQELGEIARNQRNNLLAASDWTQLPDVPEALKSAWVEYRQALRDITQQSNFPSIIQWPTEP